MKIPSKKKHHIETTNTYLNYAITELLDKRKYPCEFCIIDLTSYSSLKEVADCVDCHHDSSRFIFLGGKGNSSRALSPLVTIEVSAAIAEYIKIFDAQSGVTYEVAHKYIADLLMLNSMSSKEKMTLYSLLLNNSIVNAAIQSNISVKSFYRRVDKLGQKLNMENRIHTHQFIRDTYYDHLNFYGGLPPEGLDIDISL